MLSFPVRQGALVLGALIALTPAAFALAQGQNAELNGIFRGTVTEGANSGAAVVVTVFAMSNGKVTLKSNRPVVPDTEVVLKAEGDTLVNQEGDGRVTFKLKPGPIELRYKPNANATFVGQKPAP